MMSNQRSRRELLLAGAAGAISGLVPRTSHAADATAQPTEKHDAALPPVLKVSLAGYSFRQYLDQPGKPGKMSLFDLVDMAARWRIDAIEPTSYYFLSTDDDYLIRLKRKIILAGLEVSCTPINNNFCQPPGPELEKSIGHVKTWIDHAVKLGSPAIRVFAGNKQAGLTREQAFESAVQSFKAAAAYAARSGVFLALENHGYMTETADDVLRIIDAVGSDWLAVNLDTGNFADNAYEQIARLAPRAVTCQVKAKLREGGQAGPPDIDRIVRILRTAGYRGYVAIEYEGPDPHAQVPPLLRKLQEAIRRSA